MLDIVKFCRAHRLRYWESGHPRCTRGFIQVDCPFCGSRSRSGAIEGAYLGWSLTEGNFVCWRCGSLPFWKTLQALTRLPHHALKREVIAAQRDEPLAAPAPVARQRQIKQPAGCGPLLPAHCEYLVGRRFDPAALEAEWGIFGGGPFAGKWAWRVVFPIKNVEGRTVAYSGRHVGPNPARYYTTPDEQCLEDPRGLLYGIDKVPGSTVVVVEGPTGVWRLGPGAVATLGMWKPLQAYRLRGFEKRFILYDPEPEAQARAEGLAETLALFGGVTEIVSGFATDPGAFSPLMGRRVARELGL